MPNLIELNFEKQEIRVFCDAYGEPWWIASDICMVLGLTNTTEALRALDDDEKSTLRISEGGGPERNIINEAGLYSLIFRSNKPNAKKFKRWITHDVLPSIRETGSYEISKLSELDLIIKSAQALKKIKSKQKEHEQRLITLEAKQHQNSGHTGYWTITAWCKLNSLNMSLQEAMNKGREATKLSRKWDVDIGNVPDERFGVVNSYREDVLEDVFYNGRNMAI